MAAAKAAILLPLLKILSGDSLELGGYAVSSTVPHRSSEGKSKSSKRIHSKSSKPKHSPPRSGKVGGKGQDSVVAARSERSSNHQSPKKTATEKAASKVKVSLYCTCRSPFKDGDFMIGCDGPCEDWFHPKYVEYL